MLQDFFLKGGGEMGDLIRTVNWAGTPLGATEHWPLSLKLHTQTLLNNKIGQYIAWGPEYIQIYNDAFRPILGSSKHPLAMGISSSETFSEIWDTIGPMFANVMKGEAVGFSDFMVPLDRNGYVEECYFDFSYSPVYDEQGRIGGVLVTVIETTENVISLKKLNQSEHNLRNLVMNASVAMCVFKGPHYIVEVANQSMIELWGTASDKVMMKPIFEGLPEAKGQGLEALLDHVYKTGERFSAKEHPVDLPRNGNVKTIYVNFNYDPFTDDNNTIIGIIAVAVDVTDQVEVRQKIEESEERARLAIESADIGTYDIDLITEKIITSNRFDQIFGVKKGTSRKELMSVYHPDDIKSRNIGYEEGLKNGHSNFSIRLLLKDGTIKWIRCFIRVFYNKTKDPERILGTVIDVTSNVELQRQKDDFLAIASHELKTPLTSVKGYTQILSSLVKKGDQLTSLNILKKTERQVEKMNKLIHNFLDISKLESARLKLEKENFDINELISETINYHNLPENKERLRFNKGELPFVNADRTKISHVIDNLLSNALKYSGFNQKVIVTTLVEDRSVVVSVKDQGKGINESSKNKIFQRFFRADNVSGGSASGFGIGLYFSSEIIKMHNGKIWFISTEGEGSTFYFSIPYNVEIG